MTTESLATIRKRLRRLRELARWQRLIEESNAALASFPDDASVLAYRGEAEVGLGELAAARRTFEAVVRRSPNWDHGWWWLSFVLSKLERFDEALRAAQRSVELEPTDPWGHIRVSAAARRTSRQVDVARRAAAEAVEQGPGVAEAWWNLGEQRRHDSDMEGSEVAHRRALELEPTRARRLVSHANALLRLNRIDEAIDRFERALAAEPSYRPASLGLVSAYENAGDVNSAIAFAERGARAHPGSIETLESHVRCAMRLDPDGAVAVARAGVGRLPESGAAWALLAETLVRTDALKPALSAAMKATSVESGDEAGHKLTADILHSMGERDRAIEVLLAWRDDQPDSVLAWRRIAELVGVHDPPNAISAAERVVELAPDSDLSWACMARVHAALGDADRAAAAIRTMTSHTHCWGWIQAVWLAFVAELEEVDGHAAVARARGVAYRATQRHLLEVLECGLKQDWTGVLKAIEPAFTSGWLHCEYLGVYGVACARLSQHDRARAIVAGARLGVGKSRVCDDGACLAVARVERAIGDGLPKTHSL